MIDSMAWKKIAQEEKCLGAQHPRNASRYGGTVYQDHLATLEKITNSQENTLCFLNLRICFVTFFVPHFFQILQILGQLLTSKVLVTGATRLMLSLVV